MLPCPDCERHVRGEELECPFCATVLRSVSTPIPGAAIVIAVGAVLSGCSPAISDMGATTTDGSTSDPASTGPSTNDSATTSVNPVTSAGPSTTGIDDTGEFSTTDATVGTTSTDDDTFDTCGGFYGGCPVDGGVEPYECDVYEQDCPKGEKCMPWANDGGSEWNASRCSPIDDTPAAVGESCTVEGSGTSGIDDCELGTMCFQVDPETQAGTCTALCSGTAATPECSVGACEVFSDALPLCLDTCDPIEQACGDGLGCFLLGDAFACLPTTAEIPVGDPCVQITDCVPGSLCIDGVFFENCDGPTCCAQVCDTENSVCERPTQCFAIFEDRIGAGLCTIEL